MNSVRHALLFASLPLLFALLSELFLRSFLLLCFRRRSLVILSVSNHHRVFFAPEFQVTPTARDELSVKVMLSTVKRPDTPT